MDSKELKCNIIDFYSFRNRLQETSGTDCAEASMIFQYNPNLGGKPYDPAMLSKGVSRLRIIEEDSTDPLRPA